MTFEFNETLDIEALKQGFQERGFVQIKNIFPTDLAENMHNCLARETPWGFQYMGPGSSRVRYSQEQFEALSNQQKAEAFQYIYKTASSQFQYMYYFFPLTKTYLSGENPDFLLHKFFKFFNTESVFNFIREISNIPEIIRADALATKYTGNCFLHSHTDKREGSSRRIAYVLNMSKNWQPNWGGYLNFYVDDLNIEQSYMPTFNTLNLFLVPKGHSVGVVPPFCPGERLSIAGWFRDSMS